MAPLDYTLLEKEDSALVLQKVISQAFLDHIETTLSILLSSLDIYYDFLLDTIFILCMYTSTCVRTCLSMHVCF